MCRTSLVFLGAVFAAFLQTQTAVALGLGSDSPLGNEAPTVSVQATPSSFPEPPSTLHPADASAALPSQLPRKQTVRSWEGQKTVRSFLRPAQEI